MTGATRGAGNAHSFRITSFGEFMISSIHYIYNHIICQSCGYDYGLMTGLFAWISLTVSDLFYGYSRINIGEYIAV